VGLADIVRCVHATISGVDGRGKTASPHTAFTGGDRVRALEDHKSGKESPCAVAAPSVPIDARSACATMSRFLMA